MRECRESSADNASVIWSSLQTEWEHRAKTAAEWLTAERSVVDIGCGLMTLRSHLPSGTRYIGVDIVKRDADTIVVDLNASKLPAIEADAAVMLGVLEYVDNVSEVIAQLKSFPKSLISYNHASLKDLVWTFRLKPKLVNWRNHYTRRKFKRLVKNAGLTIVREQRLRPGERLYEVAGEVPAPRSLNSV